MKTSFFKSVAFFGILLFSVNLAAQSDTTKRKSIAKTPKRNLMKKEETKGLVIKTSAYRFLKGEFPLMLEFPISSNMSLDFGPSLTYYDFTSQLVVGDYAIHGGEKVPPNSRSIITFENAKVGFGATVSIKYFFENDGLLSGSGISLFLDSRVHNYRYFHPQGDWRVGRVNAKELGIMYITQELDDYFKEINIGFGVMEYNADYLKYDGSSNVSPFQIDRVHVWMPTVFYNLKIGLAAFRK